MVATIVNQAVQWLEKMGVEVELNTELEQFEFEYKDTFVILNTDTPEDVLSFTCPYVFPDESSNLNKVIFEEAKNWWAEQISTEYCFCEIVDNDCAFVCCLYSHNTKAHYENMNWWKSLMIPYKNGNFLCLPYHRLLTINLI